MKRETLTPVCRAPLLPLTLLLLPLASCLTPESLDCPPDLVCPAGERCAANARACIKDDCGDGIIQASEMCDDGNIEDGDGCSKTCTSNESCGNGIVDIMTAGGVSRREACDDGNNVDGDGCSADCLSSEFCGNGIKDTRAAEVCDDGNKANNDGCSADCRSTEECGNKIVDTAIGEVCDDGNKTNGDGCSADCLSGEQCSNNKLDPGEECDDGNTANDDGCTNTCHLARCGDGIVKKDVEECDPGNAGSTSTCNFNCTLHECGDGIVNKSAGEQCDDSNTIDTDGCTNSCLIAWCGDGVKNGAEACDPGADSTCNYNCKENQCGDGIVNTNDGEVCDDGNGDACGTCGHGCTKIQNVSKATGRIIGVPFDNLRDGETLIFNEGRTDELVFEFEKRDGLKVKGHIEVNIQGRSESDHIATAIQGAIEYQFSHNSFEWNVSTRLWNVVFLERRTEGRIDEDETINETVDVPGFIVGITSYGSGYDCTAGTGCMSNKDCKSGNCTIPTGQMKRTCQP